jgi:hypothetical protein
MDGEWRSQPSVTTNNYIDGLAAQVERRRRTITNIDKNERRNPPAHRHFDQRLLQSG